MLQKKSYLNLFLKGDEQTLRNQSINQKDYKMDDLQQIFDFFSRVGLN